ncbi:MAG: hypothetical protein KA746_04980 [Pyrinomonadaceae bacterium]|nr:hypothetical protein [Pyrinomonadaceae bacterium]MBP6213110.1 hypothetical protein [Pyrinomonadaceae bacterium]
MPQNKKVSKSRRKKPSALTKDSITIVSVRENAFNESVEVAELTAISRFGAGLQVGRECRVGRLISVGLPRSKDLKSHPHLDLAKSVVCLVQQCTEVTIDGKPAFHIGVVFVGNTFPPSYDADPTQCYRICGNGADGLFKITEVAGQFKARRHPRFQVELEVSLLLINAVDRSVIRSTGFTRDISSSGVMVVCALNANVGDKIKFGCREIDFHGFAVVKQRRGQFEYETYLHLEFVENKFPIERVLYGSALVTAPAIN